MASSGGSKPSKKPKNAEGGGHLAKSLTPTTLKLRAIYAKQHIEH